MAPLGHEKREGPAGDKLSAAADDEGYGGRVRKERSDWSPPGGSPQPSAHAPCPPVQPLERTSTDEKGMGVFGDKGLGVFGKKV